MFRGTPRITLQWHWPHVHTAHSPQNLSRFSGDSFGAHFAFTSCFVPWPRHFLGAVLGGEQSPAASLPCRRAPRALSLPWQRVKGCFVQRAQRRLVPLAAARRPLAGGLQGGEEQGHEGTALPPHCQRPSCILSP